MQERQRDQRGGRGRRAGCDNLQGDATHKGTIREEFELNRERKERGRR